MAKAAEKEKEKEVVEDNDSSADEKVETTVIDGEEVKVVFRDKIVEKIPDDVKQILQNRKEWQDKVRKEERKKHKNTIDTQSTTMSN